jgi:hypothetical protein
MQENHELVSPDSIYSGHSSSQLLDARFSGCRCYLDYLLIRRTLKHAANSSAVHGGEKRRGDIYGLVSTREKCHAFERELRCSIERRFKSKGFQQTLW